jgi:hypothetical protein
MRKIILLALSTVVTIAIPAAIVIHNPAPASAQRQKAPLTTYAIEHISFKVPSSWVDQSNGNTITLYNERPPQRGGGAAPKGMVKLAASTLNWSLEAAITPDSRGMTRTIQKTERLTIDGKKAVRIYGTHDEADFLGSVTTYIAKSTKETVVLITFYQDTQVPTSVNQIHNSIHIR